MIKTLSIFFLLTSFVMAQPPGTGRAITLDNGTTQYFSTGGRYLGQSQPNSLGGQNYYTTRGLYSQSVRTGNTNRFYQFRKPAPLQQNRPFVLHGHTIVSPPGSSIGIRRGK